MYRAAISIVLWGFVQSAIPSTFPCTQAATPVEKAICGDSDLSKLDDRLSTVYAAALNTATAQDARSRLVSSQQAWLDRRNRCIDKRCLRRVHEERIRELQTVQPGPSLESHPAERRAEPSKGQTLHFPQQIKPDPIRSEPANAPAAPNQQAERVSPSEALVPFRPSKSLAGVAPRSCEFQNLRLPAEFSVFATGSYAGRKLDWQIDQSGHSATQIDVAVNHPNQPVVLFLGAYEPTVWNIGWTQGTTILAVLVSGYHRQALAGLDPSVPTINSSYDNRGPCGYFYLSGTEGGLGQLNPLARRLFGRPVNMVFPVRNGIAMVGEATAAALVTHPARTPDSFRDANAPLAGQAGLEDAVRNGLLRRATQSDAQAWSEAVASSNPNRDVPPVAGVGIPKPTPPRIHNGYVVLKDFTFPAGLYGAHSATFFVARGAPKPTGNPGHSAVYDFNTLTCHGALCAAGR
ncbi:MAG: DUF1311 domain-containing protein [Burkholderiales bacterium]|nr:DUF1311 domain-containing protein [Burkholderiales bacterium]